MIARNAEHIQSTLPLSTLRQAASALGPDLVGDGKCPSARVPSNVNWIMTSQRDTVHTALT